MLFRIQWKYMAISLLAIVAVASAVIVFQQIEMGEEVLARLIGANQTQVEVLPINLSRMEKPYLLILRPYFESGWGEEDVMVDLQIVDSEGVPILKETKAYIFGMEGSDAPNISAGKFNFFVENAGLHEISVKTYAHHVEQIHVSVGYGSLRIKDSTALFSIGMLLTLAAVAGILYFSMRQ